MMVAQFKRKIYKTIAFQSYSGRALKGLETDGGLFGPPWALDLENHESERQMINIV